MSNEEKDNVAAEPSANAVEKEITESPPEESSIEKDEKPETPGKIMKVGKGEPIFRILISLLIAVVFLGFPYVIGFWASALPVPPALYLSTAQGFWAPLFNLNILESLWILIILWTLACIVGEIIKMVISCYNKKYALTTTITAALIVIFTGIMFLHPRIMNVGFVDSLQWFFANPINNVIRFLLENANIIIFIVILLIALVEIILSWFRAGKYSAKKEEEKEEENAEDIEKAEDEKEESTEENVEQETTPTA